MDRSANVCVVSTSRTTRREHYSSHDRMRGRQSLNDADDEIAKVKRLVSSIDPNAYKRKLSSVAHTTADDALDSQMRRRSNSLASIVDNDQNAARRRLRRHFLSFDANSYSTDAHSEQTSNDANDTNDAPPNANAVADSASSETSKRFSVPLFAQSSVVDETPSAVAEQSVSSQMRRYSKKRLRGPYGEMLETSMQKSQMKKNEIKTDLSFLEELLSETRLQRQQLDLAAKETRLRVQSLSTRADNTTQSSIGFDLNLDTRTRVVGEIYDTEKSYVESLRTLQERYYEPLLAMDADVDADALHLIFFKTRELLAIHAHFLEALRARLKDWSAEQTIGQLFAEHLSPPAVTAAYRLFVENWSRAHLALTTAKCKCPEFARFVESASRAHRNKLSLNELLIAPVQRVPRYELLVKQLVRHTPADHPDRALLEQALDALHALAQHINHAPPSTNATFARDLDALLEQSHSLLSPLAPSAKSLVLFEPSVCVTGSGQRALFLFADCLVLAVTKERKWSSDSAHFRFASGHALLDLELTPDGDPPSSGDASAADLSLVRQIGAHVAALSLRTIGEWPALRVTVDDMARELSARVERESAEMSGARLSVTSSGDVLSLVFQSAEKRQAFESSFAQTKSACGRRTPCAAFLTSIPIRKTRAGLQFTCASATLDTASRSVWICCSDGFAAQISVLTTSGEPTVISCNGVANARILCITAVPKADAEALSPAEDSSGEEPSAGDTCSLIRSSMMWFGTDSADIHMYSASDAIRIKKNKLKVTLSAQVEDIVYFSERVFAALTADRAVAVFERLNGLWSTDPQIRSNLSVYRFAGVESSFLLSAFGDTVVVRDRDLTPLNEITVKANDDAVVAVDGERQSTRAIVSMVWTRANDGFRVFVAFANSCLIQVIAASARFESLALHQSVDVTPAVVHALHACDHIIRKHKKACLRITCLLAVGDRRVWFGTSAGVIGALDAATGGDVEALVNGHTGHVRFLTGVSGGGGRGGHLVISGGDGFERFGAMTSTSEAESARDDYNSDSTNHLLVWTVNT